MTAPNPVRVAVIGVGHLGKEHARIYATSPAARLMAVCDPTAETRERVSAQWSVPGLSDYRELKDVEAVSIVTPTSLHHEVARHFLERGVHVLVEKPMTKTLEQADELIALADARRLKLQVGHIERFNPVFMGAVPFATQPRYIESYRISPFSFRSADIGVVLDLMIHDLDIVQFLVNSPVTSIDAIGVPVFGRHEDVANVRLGFANGCVATLTASRVSMKRERKIRGFFGDCYLSLDYDKRQGVIYRKNAAFARGEISLADVNRAEITDVSTFAFAKFLEVQAVPMEEGEALRTELESFLDCIRGDTPPVVSGRDGRNAIAMALEIIRQIQSRLAAHAS